MIAPSIVSSACRKLNRSRNNIPWALLVLCACLAGQRAVHAAHLTIDEGVVVKFGADAGMTVRQGLRTNTHVIFTSVHDDSAGNQTGASVGLPNPGDWRGIKVEDSSAVEDLQIDRLTIRYAGANGEAALEIARGYAIEFLKIADSVLGVRTKGAALPTFTGLSLVSNTVGLESREDARPTLVGSEAAGNTEFGVLNLSPSSVVQATGTWWGAASGPNDPIGNPAGLGDKVSTGVNYGAFSAQTPLIDCSLAIADGHATVAQPSVTLALECRNAIRYRLAASSNFGSTPFQSIASTVAFPLSGAAGDRQIYVEYQAATLNTKIASVVVHYQPGAPVVTIDSPTDGATIVADTTISATVSDASGVDHVDFYVGSAWLGADATAPYEMALPTAGLTGQQTITVVATSSSGQTGQDSHIIIVQPPLTGGDTEGPQIANVMFDGGLIVDGVTTLNASGILTFDVSDASAVEDIVVLFDGDVLPNGLRDGNAYSVAIDLSGISDGSHTLTIDTSDEWGNPSERIFHVLVDTGTPSGPPVVTIAPIPVPVTGDLTITAGVSGADITRVDFYVDSTWIGGKQTPPYQLLWQIAGTMLNGPHTLLVIATNADGQTGQDSVQIDLERASDDTTPPSITNVQFAGQSLTDGARVTAPGLLTFDVADESGVLSVGVQVDATAIAGGGLNGGHYSTLLDFAGIANGDEHTVTLSATDRIGNIRTLVLEHITVDIPPTPVPTILVPANPTETPMRTVAVSGTARIGSIVRLYLNGSSTGGPLTTEFNGNFHGTVTVPAEPAGATYLLTATAETDDRGVSAATAPVSIVYSPPLPSVVVTSPPEGAEVDENAGLSIDASVVDAIGIDAVTLKIDNQPIGEPLHEPPYSWAWTVDACSSAECAHQLAVTAVNMAGRSVTATRTVYVRHPPPAPILTAYTGRVDSLAPASSYGDEPVMISGSAIDTTTNAPVPNALLKIVLQVNGFQRRINTSTDAVGAFSYRFVPQNGDAGTYVVSVIHPDQVDLPNQGEFTINRLGLQPTQYALRAARTVQSTIAIAASASPGQGASNVHFEVIADDQPSRSVPAGIAVSSDSVTVPPGGHCPGTVAAGCIPISVSFTAGDSASAPESVGTLVLTAKDAGGHSRGLVTINYTLSDPGAYLFPQPSSIQTGAQRNGQVSESVQLSNRGLIPAHNVLITLEPGEGSSVVPPWVRLASPGMFDEVPVGGNLVMQIVAAPTSEIGDGDYKVMLHVHADGIDGDVPVSIAVTSDQVGGVQFHAKDIHTCRPGCTETPGLSGASIRVQNEQVPTLTQAGTTDEHGILQFTNLPTGHYRYIANAASHVASTGRFTVRPGISVEQELFLDYELVTFEWSVTETTIQDHYDVTLTATFETEVPAPVVLIEPPSINLPDMQEGEELAGEITITNYGLVRADSVVWTPAVSDDYYDFEYLGTPPDTLDAHQVFHLPYRVTKKPKPLPGTGAAMAASPLRMAGAMFRSVKSGSSSTAGTCYAFHYPMFVADKYQCAAGDQRSGSASGAFNKAYGQNCGGSSGAGGGGGGAGGGWGGGGGGGPVGTAMSSGPGCVPICPDCNGGHPGG